MPKLKKYQDRFGYYIHAPVEQSVVTYQTTPGARRLFNKLGYEHGSSIPWKMISQLSDRGDVYTLSNRVESPGIEDDIILSGEQQDIYENYLQSGFVGEGGTSNLRPALRDLISGSSKLTIFKIDKMISQAADPSLKCSLNSFADVPYELVDVTVASEHVSYEFHVSEDVTLTCRDLRLSPGSNEFSGSVNYDCQSGRDATYIVENGYFSDWSSSGGSRSEAEYIEDAHKESLELDLGSKTDSGFDMTDWTEVVRRLFVYVDGYDIRPLNDSHADLCNVQELEGNDIWVNAHRTMSSSKSSDTYLILDELIDIYVYNSDSAGEIMINIEEISSGTATGHKTEMKRAL